MTKKLDLQKLRREYQSLDEQLAQSARDCFMDYLNKLIDRYGVYTKTTKRLNVAGTLENLGTTKADQNLFTNWLEGKSNPLSGNHSREQNLDVFLRFHLYEFELDENEPLDFASVTEAFDRLLDKCGQEPLYVFNRADFRVMLAMQLQNYEGQTPRDIFVGIYNTFKDLKGILPKAISTPENPNKFSMKTEHVDVTFTAYRNFIRIQSLGDDSDDVGAISGTSAITAFQFIRHYRESFDRVRVSPFLILSECVSGVTIDWVSLEKSQLTSLAQDNIETADQLSGDLDLEDETLPSSAVRTLRSFVSALQYGSTMDRASLILFCALFLNEDRCREYAGKNLDRNEFLSYFNDMILAPCGYSPMDPDSQPKSKEEFAVLAAILDAELSSSSHGYPLGEYICEVFLECPFTRIMDPVTTAIFSK